MTFNKSLFLTLGLLTTVFISGCSEARYAAHVVKQIPFPGDPGKHVGYFKVGSSYKIKGRRYQPKETYNYTETGIASWYGPGFDGKMTANGEIFDEDEFTAAHKTLQLPSIIRVTNLSNGRTIILRVNDRGPFAHDRILDVSDRAASVLGFKHKGTAKIRLEVLGDASREVASRAKSGRSTKGYEVALNQGKTPPSAQRRNIHQVALNNNATPTSQQVTLLRKPAPVESVNLSAPPKPPILGTGKLYVQAGAFSNEQNALNFSQKMASYGKSKVYLTRINDKPFYRVRLGPYNDRAQASAVINSLSQSGNGNAVIVAD
jgi:rare lipoprotein A